VLLARGRALATIVLSLLLALVLPAIAAEARTASPETVTIGTKAVPPFAMKRADGTWEGISIDLWNRAAEKLDLETVIAEADQEGLFTGVREGRFNAAVAAITVTAEREQEFDFSHPIYSTGLGIAVREEGGGWKSTVLQFVSLDFLRVVVLLLALLAFIGLLAWLFERKRNPEQFAESPVRGLGGGLWWAAVTMTTVGYGDKSPVTVGGRIIGLIWMFAAIIIISSLTAAITTSLTVSQLDTLVEDPDDLYRVRVAGVSGTTSEQYLKDEGITYRGFPSLEEAIKALAEGKADAVVHDAPLLKYQIRRLDERLTVLPHIFDRQDYAIMLPARSELREPLNRVLLEEMQTRWWPETIQKYLGK
jgi:ABC-type amino acid transport substrate-binding protein